MSIPQMVTIQQAAEQSGLAKHYIRQLCLKSKICYVKAGNKFLINLEKLIEYLNTGDTESFVSTNYAIRIRDLSKI